jgi:hypothetical protein
MYGVKFEKLNMWKESVGIEVVGCINIAKRRNIISEEDFTHIYNALDGLIKRIQSLRKSIT